MFGRFTTPAFTKPLSSRIPPALISFTLMAKLHCYCQPKVRLSGLIILHYSLYDSSVGNHVLLFFAISVGDPASFV